METAPNQISQNPTISSDVDQNHERAASGISDNGAMESQHEIAEEETRDTLKAIAESGNFWHDWDKLKSMLSFYLKQVLSEYEEAKMTREEQSSLLGESFIELEKRLDDALHSFAEGPPFTLQRICEILLDARSIYPNLSKLALALEKNLLVTSMLSVYGGQYAPATALRTSNGNKGTEDSDSQPNSLQNGGQSIIGDGDEIMAEVEEAEVDDGMTIDMETIEEIVRSSERNDTPTGE